MDNYVFNECRVINSLLIEEKENEARESLIRLLDYHNGHDLEYTPLINNLIRETGLFPYLEPSTSDWEERFIHEAFKVDVGDKEPLTLHREQSSLLRMLLEGVNIAVSAPTSFGKSFVIDAFIKIKKPKNVIIIVPTLALTDETRRRLYKKFSSEYKIITTTDVTPASQNIFIFPQERAISYINAVDHFDILVVDEFYKASYNFDKQRSPSLVKAMIKLGEKSSQKYYLAPNITSIEENPFTKDMKFVHLDFSTVFLEKIEMYEEIGKDELIKSKKLVEILKSKKTNSLIYAGTYSNIDSISTVLLTNIEDGQEKLLLDFSDWLGKNYAYNWSLTSMVKKGAGVHNGRLHRSLSQIQVRLFEDVDGLNTIVSTSSIIEGVNTSAENVIIWMNKNGRSKLNDFTYRNIIGRGGRMFKHFIGKIYILDKPPVHEKTQLDIPFPEEIIGDLDAEKYGSVLTKEQVAKIKVYSDEMSEILGVSVYNRLKEESAFQSSNAEFIKILAIDMSNNPDHWNGLSYLNSYKPHTWTSLLYKLINLQPGNWETSNRTFVEFIKVISKNWFKTIPELLKNLEEHDVGIDDFFKLERNLTYKFSALLKDVNTLQKEILKHKRYDISRFISWCTNAFLPPVVFQLEEYGLPRIISRKLHQEKVFNFFATDLTIHITIDMFNSIGRDKILECKTLDDFDKYIVNYFFDGIEKNSI